MLIFCKLWLSIIIYTYKREKMKSQFNGYNQLYYLYLSVICCKLALWKELGAKYMNTWWGEREHKVRKPRTFSEQDGVKRADFRNTGADFVNTIIYLPYNNVMQVREIGTILLCISCSLWGRSYTSKEPTTGRLLH